MRWLAGELGDVQNLRQQTAYSGCALSLIDALSTLAVIGDRARFQSGINWLLQNVSAYSTFLLSAQLVHKPCLQVQRVDL